ncbi:MAG: hypothetical protein IJL32_01215 [Oscillospiraceae bacterium]|nr:hypothetical protein [Oscillospiraceae bacterium]
MYKVKLGELRCRRPKENGSGHCPPGYREKRTQLGADCRQLLCCRGARCESL